MIKVIQQQEKIKDLRLRIRKQRKQNLDSLQKNEEIIRGLSHASKFKTPKSTLKGPHLATIFERNYSPIKQDEIQNIYLLNQENQEQMLRNKAIDLNKKHFKVANKSLD